MVTQPNAVDRLKCAMGAGFGESEIAVRRYIVRIDDELAEEFERWVDEVGVSVTAVLQAGVEGVVDDWQKTPEDQPPSINLTHLVSAAREIDARRRRRKHVGHQHNIVSVFLVFAMAGAGLMAVSPEGQVDGAHVVRGSTTQVVAAADGEDVRAAH